jgi:hypothetical protein
MIEIKLNYINHSNDTNGPDVVIFQKNVAAAHSGFAVAWRLIQNLGRGFMHPFVFPADFTVAASDSYGSYTPQLPANNGQLFSVVATASGDVLQQTGPSASVDDIEVLNTLEMGAINAHIYRDGKLLGLKAGVVPAQRALFQFNTTIWIGVVPDVVEGDIMNAAILSEVNTEISLTGISSASIVLTGGGEGARAKAYLFTLQDVVYA